MKTEVKILAVADVHGDMDKVDVGDAEIVIVAGDIGPDPKKGSKEHSSDVSKAWARNPKTVGWFRKHANVRFYILPGNHDKFAKHHDDRKLVRKLWPENVKLIKDDGYVDESGLTIWGMPWNPEKKKGRGTFSADSGKIQRKCAKIARHFKCLDILVTHAPPLLKEIASSERDWHLSPTLDAMLGLLNPMLLICGHKHDLSHVPFCANHGKTTVVNVAMKRSHVLIEDGGSFEFKPRMITVTIERNVGFDMDMRHDMRIR